MNQLCSLKLHSIAKLTTHNNFYCSGYGSFAVSHEGEKLTGVTIIDNNICKVLQYNYENDRSILFEYEHKSRVQCLLVSQAHNLILAGEKRGILIVYDAKSYKPRQKLNLNIGLLSCFYSVNNVLCVGGFGALKVFNLINMKTIFSKVTSVECGSIRCMKVVQIEPNPPFRESSEVLLYVGGSHFGNFTKIYLPNNLKPMGQYSSILYNP